MDLGHKMAAGLGDMTMAWWRCWGLCALAEARIPLATGDPLADAPAPPPPDNGSAADQAHGRESRLE